MYKITKKTTPIDMLIDGKYLKENEKSYMEITSAIKRYQDVHGLLATGRMNIDTLIKMNLPDYQIKSIPIASFWNKKILTYRFDNFNVSSSTKISSDKIRKLFIAACEIWTKHIPISFKEVNDDPVDIHIGFYYGEYLETIEFKDWKPWAYTFYPPLNGYSDGIYGDILFNSKVTWTEDAVFDDYKIDFLTIAGHEIGHAIGLKHSHLPESIMFENLSSPVRRLTDDDVLAIQDVYGERFA